MSDAYSSNLAIVATRAKKNEFFGEKRYDSKVATNTKQTGEKIRARTQSYFLIPGAAKTSLC
jgi:hypothetical protein